ncbi:DegT/DnrJ/EryC1/StrS family aminotransferase [Verrucomicrobia bacterium]|nr:DegT/DnrJ/EryC1/StrS family aminotransferase [Verrucomicrobiota bacterium]
MDIPLFDLNYDHREQEAIKSVLESKWISMGPKVQELEQRFAALHSVGHGVGLANCTAALHLSMRLLGVKPGDEVIVPSLTFAATVNCVLMQHATPVFADICSNTDWTIDAEDVLSKITSKTKAIIVMHYGGHGADMPTFRALADEYKIGLVEDACHAPGGSMGDRMLGSFGDLACYSFYSNKNLAIGEGGMLITDNQEFADRARLLRSHGMTTTAYDRVKGKSFYKLLEYGYNYRMDDIHGALGCVQLDKLEEDLTNRERLVKRYRQNLSGIEKITIPFDSYQGRSSNYIFGILVETEDREALREKLKADGIGTSMHYPPVHQFSAYLDFATPLKMTELVGRQQLSLPLYSTLELDSVDYVCEKLIDNIKSQ